MATIPNFDDFLDGLPRGPAVDSMAAQVGLTRNLNETDAALLLRIQIALGYSAAGPEY